MSSQKLTSERITDCDLSVIVPVGPGDAVSEALLQGLSRLKANDEALFVYAEDKKVSSSQPSQFFHDLKCRQKHIWCRPGRARQQNAGAFEANNQFLWFLHSDTKIDPQSVEKIKSTFRHDPSSLYYFDLNFFDHNTKKIKLNEWGAAIRSQIFKMPFGDQGFTIQKNIFFELGAFDESALYGEDHLFVWQALQNNISVKSLNLPIYTSARKYNKVGWLTTTAKHLYLTYKQAAPEFFKLMQLKLNIKSKKRVAIAIFVKTPGHSPLKTRLAATLGAEKTIEFYKKALVATSDVLKELSSRLRQRSSDLNIDTFWAVAEKEALTNTLWRGYQTLWQGEGQLGDRLNTVYKKLKATHDVVCFIGADSPHITVDEYCQLIQKSANLFLKGSTQAAPSTQDLHSKAPFIFGACDDGGFFFFSGEKNIPEKVWLSVEYSSAETLSQLQKQLQIISPTTTLSENFDIDTEADLRKYLTIDKTKNTYLQSQLQLFDWVRDNLSVI